MVKLIIGALCILPFCLMAEMRMDSVGTRIYNGEKFILHKVTKGETLFALTRRYNVPVDAIKKANPVKSERINIGDTLMIPTGDTGYATPKSASSEAKQQVEPGNRDQTPIKKTEIPKEDRPALPEERNAREIEQPRQTASIQPPEYLPSHAQFSNRNDINGQPVLAVVMSGKVRVLTDSRVQEQPMYAIHNELPEGTLIKVVNPENQKFVIVKTLKANPAQTLNPDVVLYISPVAARYLDAQTNPDKMELRFTLSER